MAYCINCILVFWGLFSLIIVVIAFFNDSDDYIQGVNLIDNPDEILLNTLHFYHEYPRTITSNEHTLIYSNEYPVRNIRIYEYTDSNNNWSKGKIIQQFLPPNHGLLLHIDRQEGVAAHKISWQIEYGATAEYIFDYNGATGDYNMTSHNYHYGIISKTKKILGIR